MGEQTKIPSSPIADVDLQHEAAPKQGPSTPIGPQPAKIDKIAHNWNLTTSYTIDIGDVEVGREKTHRASIFAINQEQGPRIQARVTGEPAIRYTSGPNFVPGTRRTHDPSNEFVFSAKPTHSGRLAGTLEVEVLDAPQEIHRMPIIAAAHNPGDATLDEQKRESDEQQKRDGEQKERSERLAEERKQIERNEKVDHHVHDGADKKLEVAKNLAKARLEKLQLQRRNGIDAANTEIGDFRRAKPVSEESGILFELAVLALSMATAGIAGALAKRLQPLITSALTTSKGPVQLPWIGKPEGPAQQFSPTDALVALVTDGIKQGVKDLGKKAVPTKKPADAPREPPGSTGPSAGSTDPKTAFLMQQRDALVDSHETATQITDHAALVLRPLIRSKRDATELPPGTSHAVAVMEGIGEAANAEVAATQATQLHETVKHWVRHLANSSVGVIAREELKKHGMRAGDGGPVTSAGRASDKHVSDERFDGLIDLTFTAVQADPTAAVRVTKARLLGVKKAVVDRFKRVRLLDAGLPVRAICEFTPQQSLIVARDEAGNIDYWDDTSGKVEASSWFARRVGVRARARKHDQVRGARDLIERDIMNQSLATLVGEVENDDAG